MSSKKRFNLVIASLLIIISALAVIFSNNISSFSSPFQAKISPSPDDVGQEVQGVSTSNTSPSEVSLDQESQGDSPTNSEGQEVYQVVKVVDGDTLEVDLNGTTTKIRIIGIDTPETVDPRKPVQCFGKEASNKAKEILSNQLVTLVADQSQGNTDKYKRLLRYVYLPDGTDYGLYMISNGYAHEYTYDIPYEHQAQYKQAQADAMNGDKGLWSPNTCNGNTKQ